MNQPPTDSVALKRHADAVGADLLSIASIERFEGLPPERHPASIFPEVRSVVVVAKRIARGALRGVEEGTQFDLYRQFGRDWLNNRVLATVTYRVSEYLEDNGWEAVPLPNLPPEVPPMGIPVRNGAPAPNVMLDFDDAAVRAGMGTIGDCGLLLTRRFGPRQRIQVILTDAALEPDPLQDSPVCLGCTDLDDVCPLGAIRREAGRTTVCDDVCRSCRNGVEVNPYHAMGRPDRCASLCTRNCVARLEEAGALTESFHNAFRKRAPWGFRQELKRL